MLPRWHIFWGGIFTILVWAFSEVSYLNLSLIFFSSFLIDFDHYLSSAMKTKKLGLRRAFQYYKDEDKVARSERSRGIRRRGDFHLFHTLEFHVLVGVLSLLYIQFFFIFIGMVFHSLLDIGYIIHKDFFYRREFFFFNWLKNRAR
tara:strand:+ start:1988 stop:2425 length:438 start_codon:yes stop_codon:yes gene_type:complete